MRLFASLLVLSACGGSVVDPPIPAVDAGVDAPAVDVVDAGPVLCCVFNDGTGAVCCDVDGAVAFFYDSAGRSFGCQSPGEQCATANACAGIAPDGHSHLGHCENR